MIIEFGHFALILALLVALVLAVVPMAGSYTGQRQWMAMAKPAASILFYLVLISFCCLTWAFIQNDFTVAYVAQNSNSRLPIYYRISAVWGAHEGSLLLWVLILTLWSYLVARRSQHLPLLLSSRVLSILGLITIGFLAFTLFTSNPFERTLPMFPVDGRDLNPLLQDFGLIVHPPMLYMGYVGFSVAFAFAIAALLEGKLDSAWARWARPWTLAAWIFLTAGISLGSWWAYYELGWGGWWFWDPVENASFMPWLVGTALLHSLAVSDKRGNFKAWTVLLAISAFSLSLLGTFLVRSGVLTSVHAFATDPERGLFILIFLLIVIGGSLSLFAAKSSRLTQRADAEWYSKDTALLLNNVLLSVTALVVLIGTLQPLVNDALNLGKISVGPPYFDLMFSVFMLPLMVLVGIGPMLRWRKDDWQQHRKVIAAQFIVALGLTALILLLLNKVQTSVVVGLFLALWLLGGLIRDWTQRLKNRPSLVSGIAQLPRAFVGMSLAHLGLAVSLLGIVVTNAFSIERDVRMVPGQTIEVGGYQFKLQRLRELEGPNYHSTRAIIEVRDQGHVVTMLRPEKRTYMASRSTMTEASIHPSLTRDLYVALGEPLDGDAWAVRVYYKPFVRWIWLGTVFMVIGGILAGTDRRYRAQVAEQKAKALSGQELGA